MVDLRDLLKFCKTKKQRQSVEDCITYGGVRPAAKATGKPRSTIRDHIAAVRRYADSTVQPAFIKENDGEPHPSKRIKELEDLVKKQQEIIESSRTFNIPIGGGSKKKGANWCRVVVPDTHGSAVDEDAIATFLDDLETIVPSEVIMLGDHLECGGFLAQHHTLGYVAQTDYTFQDDVAATNELLDLMQKIVPEADIDYIEGNHERRIENWCTTQALKNPVDAEYLRSMFSVNAVLGLDKRGINWIRQGEYYDGVALPATIKRGHCYFTHGSSTAMHAASVHVKKFGGNVVYGHTHRADSYTIRNVKEGSLSAWNPGCLCKLQPLWQHTNPTDWSHGYGLQLVNEDGTFLHINIPIVDGQSFLEPLVRSISGV